MRNAALTLGLIGGLLAMIVGFFGYGYTVFVLRPGGFPSPGNQSFAVICGGGDSPCPTTRAVSPLRTHKSKP